MRRDDRGRRRAARARSASHPHPPVGSTALVERVLSRGLVAVGLVVVAGCAHHDDLRLVDFGVELGAGVGDRGGSVAEAVLVAGGAYALADAVPDVVLADPFAD